MALFLNNQTLQGNLSVTNGSSTLLITPLGIGVSAGSGALNAFAIGNGAGTTQGTNAIAFGHSSGVNQASYCIAIGELAGNSNQLGNAVAVGPFAGQTSQGSAAVAIGVSAGTTSQGGSAIAIGNNAGQTSQTGNGLAIGTSAGHTSQGTYGIAIGGGAGANTQGANAIAIGQNAGSFFQGANAIGIGQSVGFSSQVANSICLNATGSSINPAVAGFIVTPVRNTAGTTPKAVAYDTTNNEFIYPTGALVTQGIASNLTPASVSGSTSGSLSWTQPEQGTGHKKVIIYCSALVGTATFTFTAAFAHTPNIATTDGPASSVVTSLSTTSVTVTGATTTGFIILEGF